MWKIRHLSISVYLDDYCLRIVLDYGTKQDVFCHMLINITVTCCLVRQYFLEVSYVSVKGDENEVMLQCFSETIYSRHHRNKPFMVPMLCFTT